MAIRVSEFIAGARREYLLNNERKDPHAATRLRVFNIGDEVTVHKPTGAKRLDKLSALQDGPFEVVECGTSGADYKIRRLGKSGKPRWVHVDQIRKLRRFLQEDKAAELPEAKPHAKGWEVCKIVGEKGMTRRSKQYKVLWQGYVTTSWEPSKNIDHCAEKVKEWVELKPERQHQLSQMTDVQLTEEFEEWTLIAAVEVQGGQSQQDVKPWLSGGADRTQAATKEEVTQQQVGEFQELQCGMCSDTTEIAAATDAKGSAASAALEEPAADQQKQGGVSMDLIPPRMQTGLIREIMAKAGYTMDRLRGVMASPPCESYSLADASNISRGFFYRDHSVAEKPPRSKESYTTAVHERMRQKAIDDDDMVRYLTESMLLDWEEGYAYDAMIENPHASLRHRPFMRGERLEAALERKTINYCAYGLKYTKLTDLWTTQKKWNPRGATGNGRCNDGACRQGWRNKRTHRWNHTERIGGPSHLQPKGPNVLKELWKLPQALTHEFISQLPDPGTCDEKMVVLDLFSGGESWRRAVEAAGYIYVPVDIKLHNQSADSSTIRLQSE
jgi:hypothetical protein